MAEWIFGAMERPRAIPQVEAGALFPFENRIACEFLPATIFRSDREGCGGKSFPFRHLPWQRNAVAVCNSSAKDPHPWKGYLDTAIIPPKCVAVNTGVD